MCHILPKVVAVCQALLVQQIPVYWRFGGRHLGGMTTIRARLRNSGTCLRILSEMQNDAKQRQNSDDWHWDGAARCGDEQPASIAWLTSDRNGWVTISEILKMRILRLPCLSIVVIAHHLNPKPRRWSCYFGRYRGYSLSKLFYILRIKLVRWARYRC